nr:hypothetical protein [Tanacetum cinerariifolium]
MLINTYGDHEMIDDHTRKKYTWMESSEVTGRDKVSEHEKDTNEELDNQDTSYANHVEQSSSNECHKLDPPEEAYYYKSDCPNEEYMARRLQMDAKSTNESRVIVQLGKGKGTWEGRVVAFGTVPVCCSFSPSGDFGKFTLLVPGLCLLSFEGLGFDLLAR